MAVERLGEDHSVVMARKQALIKEEIALWTSVEGNGFIHYADGTIGHGLAMDIATTIVTGLSSCECTYAICLYCPPDTKASEQEEQKWSLKDRCL